MPYIFCLELIVDDLNIFSDGTEETACPSRGELCVRLQLANLARCEVCEKDFGSTPDLELPRKTGENCLFVYNPTLELSEEEPSFRISAHEKPSSGGTNKKLLGFWQEPAREMLDGLVRSFDVQNGVIRPDSLDSRESLHSSASNGSGKRNKPVSNTLKTMYPLKSESDGVARVVGFVVATIRMSCLGPNLNQKVLLEGRDLQQKHATTSFKMPDEPIVKCVTVEDELEEAQRLAVPESSLASISAAAQGIVEEQPYDEYAAELNGNAICIRVEKDANIAVNIDGEGGEENGCSKGCWTTLTLPDGVYGLQEEYIQRQVNGCRLPVVRGTLKYPAYHWSGDFLLAKKTTPVTIEDFRKRPDTTRTVGLQSCGPEEHLAKELAGIEICRKGWHDPNVDVFVLKLGKHKTDAGSSGNRARNQIEIELRTPKGPSREIRPKETRGVQVLEDEFESPVSAAPPAPQKPAAGPRPSALPNGAAKAKKPAGKKGKKK